MHYFTSDRINSVQNHKSNTLDKWKPMEAEWTFDKCVNDIAKKQSSYPFKHYEKKKGKIITY